MALGTLTACGGSTKSTDTAGTASAETIKVGILGPHTGDYAQYGVPVRNGAQLYIDQVNAAGGVNGKQIETIVYDQKGDSAEAVTAFSRMVDEGITGLVGDVLSGNTIAVVGEANPINMPMVTASATAAGVTYDEENNKVFTNVFRACFIDPFQGEKMAQYASEVLGAKTAAVIFETGNDYAVGLKDAFVAKAQELGMKVVSEQGYAKGDKDFKSQLTSIAAESPDVVFCPNYYQDDGLIVTQARDVGLTAVFMGGDGWSSVSQYADAADLEGSVYCSAYAASSTDEVKQFEADYTKVYGADTLNMFAALGYDAAKILVDGISKAEAKGLTAGTDDYKAAVIDAIKTSTDVKGVTGTYSFDEYNNPIKDAVIIQLVNGEEVFSQMF
jgi:branched-chain amino acid transport system substrate-binding protein